MFKFRMNKRTWRIIELSQEEMRQEIMRHNDKPSEHGKYFGSTYADEQIIYLDRNLCEETKRTTLLHELSHCYITTFITHYNKEYNEEDVADIISNSHDIISEIVNKYFKYLDIRNTRGQ